MYNTRLSDNRYTVTCISVINNTKILHFVVDTGAMYTCCNSKYIDTKLTEQSLTDCEIKYIGGFNNEDKKNPIKIYRYHLDQFTIGNIDLGERDIWITFENRVDDNVLGMDLLQHVTYLQLADAGSISFFNDRGELLDYVSKQDIGGT